MASNRSPQFLKGRMTSSELLTKVAMKDVIAEGANVPRALFLSAKPVHVTHTEQDMGEHCSPCRLLGKFMEAIQGKSLRPLQRELNVKTKKLCRLEMIEQEAESTLEANFSDFDDILTAEDEELITFGEVLELLNIDQPAEIKTKMRHVIKQKKIPVKQKSETNKRNCFLAYTMNKKLSEIADQLSIEEIYAMKDSILMEKEGDDKVQNMIEALSVIKDMDEMKSIEGMKETIFFYIMLTMIKESLLDRIYTHTLEFFLEGAKSLLPNPETRGHIDEAILKLKCYPLTVTPPGICIILNMIKGRSGSEKDAAAVRTVFEKDFNYDVFVKQNPTRKDVKNLQEKLGASRNMFYDSLVVWVMAHGDKSYLQLADGNIHRRDELLQPFADIEWLNKKPKLFFIQACAMRNTTSRKSYIEPQGLQTKTDSTALGLSPSPSWKGVYGKHVEGDDINSLADTLVSYATLWYKAASRIEEGTVGSLYVQTVLDCMTKFGHHMSIEEVLTNMHYSVNLVQLTTEENSTWKQTPYYESSLLKKFMLPKKD